MASNLTVPDTLPSGSATGNPFNKIALKKGRGILDWVRLANTTPNLAGTGGKLLKVTPEELAKHNKRNDAWIALKGKVYNVTPYFEFHPGGEDELMRGAGIDATALFNEVHKWVNFSSMLQKCFVGTLTEPKITFFKPSLQLFKKKSNTQAENGFLPPLPCVPRLSSIRNSIKPSEQSTSPQSPKYDWFQTKTLINIAIYTKWKEIKDYHVVVINSTEYFKVVIYLQNRVFTIHLVLHKEVESDFELKIGSCSGKVDILLKKMEQEVRWLTLGTELEDNNQFISTMNKDVEYIRCSITETNSINCNTFLYILEIPHYIHMMVPIGHHVFLKIPSTEIVKPYTPVVTPFEVNGNLLKNSRQIEIFFKVYPTEGLTSQLEKLEVGDEIEVSYPDGPFGVEVLLEAIKNSSYVILLGAGTGITPMIKIMLEALANNVKTLFLIFNRTIKDIPWKTEFESLVDTHSRLLRVIHILSSPSASWEGATGRIRKSLLDDLLPISDGENPCTFCICGPKGFTERANDLLSELGYTDENVFAFTG